MIDIKTGTGGYISVNGWANKTNPRSMYIPRVYDVWKWEVIEEFKDAEKTHSGSRGARTRKRVCIDWTARLSIWWTPQTISTHLFDLGIDSLAIRLYKSWGPEYVANQTLNSYYASKFSDVGIKREDPTSSDIFQTPYYGCVNCLPTKVRTLSQFDDIILQEVELKGNDILWDVYDISKHTQYLNYISTAISNIPTMDGT